MIGEIYIITNMNIPFFFSVFFFLSGFSSLVYEVVWLRMSMAAFGVNAPLVSIVLSVFMAGLGLGSWLAGRLKRLTETAAPASVIRLYGLCEFCIALSALAVPWLLQAAQRFMLGSPAAWGSLTHYLIAGLLLTGIILPWTVLMGATIPLAMPVIKKLSPGEAERSFSFLYLANLLGAACGTLVSAFILIELLGLKGTLFFAAGLNVLIAAAAFILPAAGVPATAKGSGAAEPRYVPAAALPLGLGMGALFFLGLSSMGMEVVWMRIFLAYLNTSVYAFAAVLVIYLLTNYAGARFYRRQAVSGGRRLSAGALLAAAGFFSVLPVFFANPYLHLYSRHLTSALRLLLGISPFAFTAGYLTPMLVDLASGGDPKKAGKVYAVNVAGCILGPLLAGFLLLPLAGERGAIAFLAAPLFVLGYAAIRKYGGGTLPSGRWTPLRAYSAALALAVLSLAGGRTFYDRYYPDSVVKRDFEATTMAFTGPDGQKALIVNGVNMTCLTPITKFMAHMPLAMTGNKPENALIIAFGMGTTFRSALSWGIDVTAVDLIPSVPEFFGYFHGDGAALLAGNNAHIITDDGRRYLARTDKRFDIIVIDPPPPVGSSASGLLYSKEFYGLAARRLKPGGLLQQWIPGAATPSAVSAAAKAIGASFPYMRTFMGITGDGVHFIVSNEPIPGKKAAELVKRLSASEGRDLAEWGPGRTPGLQVAAFMAGEIDPLSLPRLYPEAAAITDDRPFNEYFFLRQYFPGFWRSWYRAMKIA